MTRLLRYSYKALLFVQFYAGRITGLLPFSHNGRKGCYQLSIFSVCYLAFLLVGVYTDFRHLVEDLTQFYANGKMITIEHVSDFLVWMDMLVERVLFKIIYISAIFKTLKLGRILNRSLRIYNMLTETSVARGNFYSTDGRLIVSFVIISGFTLLQFFKYITYVILSWEEFSFSLRDLLDSEVVGLYTELLLIFVYNLSTIYYMGGLLFIAHAYHLENLELGVLLKQLGELKRDNGMNHCQYFDEVERLHLRYNQFSDFTAELNSCFAFHVRICLFVQFHEIVYYVSITSTSLFR